jgi:uncharacterized protein YqgC (DUF456 family)
MIIALNLLAMALIFVGLACAVLPVVPGIPITFSGIWLLAAVDDYRHLGSGWLIGIGAVGIVGISMDLLAGVLGTKRVGASRRALWGAFIGTVIGLFFGLPGVLLGPLVGAVLGELAAGNSPLRSTQVGVAAWVGLIFGTLMKLVASVTMVALTGAGWWLNA